MEHSADEDWRICGSEAGTTGADARVAWQDTAMDGGANPPV